MDLLNGYGSSASEEEEDNRDDIKEEDASPKRKIIARKADKRVLNAAPQPSILSTLQHSKITSAATTNTSLTLFAPPKGKK
eukprot:2562317-Ditylum_brightwellii.AAC.1